MFNVLNNMQIYRTATKVQQKTGNTKKDIKIFCLDVGVVLLTFSVVSLCDSVGIRKLKYREINL